MTAPDIAAIVRGLKPGSKRACLAMTVDWRFCGKKTFNANGAHALHHAKVKLGRGALAEREAQRDGKWCRDAYRLTDLGLQVQAHLKEQAS